MQFDAAVHCSPVARPDAVITRKGAKWRITVLSESLMRVEWSDDGIFEDNPTQTVVCRDFGSTPHFQVSDEGDRIVVITRTSHLTYNKQPFSREGLSFNGWHYGDSPRHGNLGGTARTLDECDGFTPLGSGVVSQDGWAVLDDSASNELVRMDRVNGQDNSFGFWTRPRAHQEHDLYLFGHGHDYAGAVADLYRLTGSTPLLPRFALGNWWSRYHAYSQEEYERLHRGFKEAGIPFSVGVIDMDWHRVGDVDPKYGSGWTGYSWNRTLFPDPRRLLSDLHSMGLKIALNVHPADGIRAFEDDYPRVARQMGIDPASGKPVSFDIASPKFAHAYFDLHHHLEDEGVDFWWIDWQQGGVSRQKGLDPLWMLNHLHWLDSARDGRWPLTFSRYAGVGSHRYPIGFSGDSIILWKSLKFQPYFTATASNVGYGWWSNDIGGHMLGIHDNVLETRWYWLGVFSPINRLHSSNSQFLDKDPRTFPEPYRSAMIRALRLRHEMLPYLYTMNWRTHREGRPIVEQMYWDNPDCPQAYSVASEYLFGSQLLVSPVVDPQDSALHEGPADLWLPQGDWYDFFDGRHYASRGDQGRRLKVWRGLDRIPAFARAGGIVPLQRLAGGENVNSVANPSKMRVLVFPGADGSFRLVEDDGVWSPDDAKIKTAVTSLHLDWANRTFAIGQVEGNRACVPQDRKWEIVFRGVANPFGDSRDGSLTARVDGRSVSVPTHYDPQTLSLSVNLGRVSPDQSASITIPHLRRADNPILSDSIRLLKIADMPITTKETIAREIRDNGTLAVASLDALEADPSQEQVVPAFNMRGLLTSYVPNSVASALREILLRD
jgi:hypothetical protein